MIFFDRVLMAPRGVRGPSGQARPVPGGVGTPIALPLLRITSASKLSALRRPRVATVARWTTHLEELNMLFECFASRARHNARTLFLSVLMAPGAVVAGLLMLGCDWAQARTFHVPGNYETIQAAIDATAAGDTVQCEASRSYRGRGNTNLVMPYKHSIVLRGGGADPGKFPSVIDCEQSARGIDIPEHMEHVVDGFEIQDGYVEVADRDVFGIVYGAGIRFVPNYNFTAGGPTLIANCVIRNCQVWCEGGDCDEKPARGGGIGARILSDFQLIIRNTEVIDCIAETSGGGIYLGGINHWAPGRDSRLEGCSLIGNIALGSGGRSWECVGGGLHVGGPDPLTVVECEFRDNQAAGGSGGGIGSDRAPLILTKSVVAGNVAFIPDGPVGLRGGGGVAVLGADAPSSFLECEITDNRAGSEGVDLIHGGGVFVHGGTSEFSYTEISKNSVVGVVGKGGGVYAPNSRFTNCVVSGNWVPGNGGGVYTSNSELTSCVVSGNRAQGSGGGIYTSNSDFVKCVVSANVVQGDGGGVYMDALSSTSVAALRVENTDILNNRAEGKGSRGGGVFVLCNKSDDALSSLAVNFDGCAISSNRAEDGAGVYAELALDGEGKLWNDSGLRFLGGNVNSNVATGSGGGVYVNNPATIREPFGLYCSASMAGNSAYSFGGGLRAVSVPVEIESATISGNLAGWGGGVSIYNFRSPDAGVRIYESSIVNNTAGLEGGGVHLNSAEAVVDACLIQSNWAGDGTTVGDGGGLWSYGGDLEIRHSILGGNSAYRGGGGFSWKQATEVRYVNCSFAANSAWSGGGLHARDGSTLELENCFLDENSAQFGGGAYEYDAKMRLNNVSLRSNEAAGAGGGLYGVFSELEMSNCTLSQNLDFGDTGGGGLYTYAVDGTVRGSIFEYNATNHAGGGYCGQEGVLTMQNCNFFGNLAPNGGAMSYSGARPLQLENSIVRLCGLEPLVGDLEVSYSNVEGGGWPGTGNIDADPGFISRLGYDYVLPANSSSKDAGTGEDDGLNWCAVNTSYCRSNDATPDMGAYGGPTLVGWMGGGHGLKASGTGFSEGSEEFALGAPHPGRVPADWTNYAVRIEPNGSLILDLMDSYLADGPGIDLYVEEVDAEDGFGTDSYEVLVAKSPGADYLLVGTGTGDSTFDVGRAADNGPFRYVKIQSLEADVEIDAISVIHQDAPWARPAPAPH